MSLTLEDLKLQQETKAQPTTPAPKPKKAKEPKPKKYKIKNASVTAKKINKKIKTNKVISTALTALAVTVVILLGALLITGTIKLILCMFGLY